MRRARRKLQENDRKRLGQVEIREHYQSENIRWLSHKKTGKVCEVLAWKKALIKHGIKKHEYRYFISRLKADINLFSRAVRGHWSVESMDWHLNVTFREDADTTLGKQAASNHNIIRKWCLSILKLMEFSRHKLSLKKKYFWWRY